MKVVHIATTNVKGQLVIPASIRRELGITQDAPLQLVVRGNSLSITPIVDLVTATTGEDTYLDILRKTKGSWKNEKNSSSNKRKIELAASRKRRSSW